MAGFSSQKNALLCNCEEKSAGLEPSENRDAEKSSVQEKLGRVKGIEPSYSAWKAAALPLSYTRIAPLYALNQMHLQQGLSPILFFEAYYRPEWTFNRL